MSVRASETLKLKGNEAFEQKQYKKASKIYRDAIKLNSSNPVLYSNRAFCFIKLEDYERALRDCIAGLELSKDPKTSVKLLYRKYLSLIALSRPEDAKQAILTANKLDPSNKQISDALKSLSPQEAPIVKRAKNGDHIIKIEIVRVESIPTEFNLEASAQHQRVQQVQASKIEEVVQRGEVPSTDRLITVKSSHLCWMELKAIVAQGVPSNENERQEVMHRLFSTPFEIYQHIFDEQSRSGVSEDFLNFILDLITEASIIQEPRTVLEHMKFFSTCRRFSLSKMFLNTDKVRRAAEKLDVDVKELQMWI